MYQKIAAVSALIAAARAQKACSLTTENHPSLTWQKCTSSGCSNVQGSVVLDANWRWTHDIDGSSNCYDGNSWVDSLCPDPETCTESCCVDGADYSGTYGVSTSGSNLNIKFVTDGPYSTNVGSRVYLMEDENSYEMFTLLDNEFTFDVDVSDVGCGLNGALYFVSMDQDGGAAEFPGNEAGAKYGTGYCDSQCPRDLKFIAGQANVEGWSGSDENSGVGRMGACCAEMDIWEANREATAYTPHPCEDNSYHVCLDDDCGGTYAPTDRYAGDCDPDGCDFNSYRQGDKTFYGTGSGFTVDSSKKLTIVTQFLKGSDGKLSEIKRFYVQDGEVIPNSESTIAGNPGNSITEEFCTAQKIAFGDDDIFNDRGGLAQMSDAVEKPMVLVMSLWSDNQSNMLWLDSTFPVDRTGPGAERGPCSTDSGVPSEVIANQGDSTVKFSNIKFGPIGSTFDSGSVPDPGTGTTTTRSTSTRSSSTTTRSSTTTTSNPPTNTQVAQKWGQCGGNGWTGPTTCVSGSTCTKLNDWYYQCL